MGWMLPDSPKRKRTTVTHCITFTYKHMWQRQTNDRAERIGPVYAYQERSAEVVKSLQLGAERHVPLAILGGLAR